MVFKKLPQYVATLSVSGGAFIAGTIIAWKFPAEQAWNKGTYDFDISKFLLIISSMTFGAIFSGIFTAILMKKYGKKCTMLLLVILFFIGWDLFLWGDNFYLMIIGRFLLGIGCGAVFIIGPIYISEIANIEIRGQLVSIFHLMFSFGLLFVYFLQMFIELYTLNIICLIISLIFGIFIYFMPETPLYLVSKGRSDDAIKSIHWLRGLTYDYYSELADLQLMVRRAKENPWTIIRPETVKSCIIGMGLIFFQQMSGYNYFIFYILNILEISKALNPSQLLILICGIQIMPSLISTYLVDRVGRKILLLISGGLMSLSTMVIGIFFCFFKVSYFIWIVWSVISFFLMAYSTGFAQIPWIIISEIFPYDVKEFSVAFAGIFYWNLLLILEVTFPIFIKTFGQIPIFFLFSIMTIFGTIFIYIYVPETKKKSFSFIQKDLAK